VGICRYQDLVAWQLANELKRQVYALVDATPAKQDLRFSDQIRDAAASGPSNLAEAFGAFNHPEAARYARIARSSIIETHNHLGDGVDRRHWSDEEAAPVQELADRAKKATGRWLEYLTKSDAPSRWNRPGSKKRR
jgi:four helix bundle protein